MRIGIAAPVGVGAFVRYFHDKTSIEILTNNDRVSAASAISTLIHALIAEGNFVRLFTLTKTNFRIVSKEMEIIGIKKNQFYPIKYSIGVFVNSISIYKKIRTLIEDLDILHAHWTYEYAYASAKFSSNLPVFCTVRDFASFIWKIVSLKNKIPWTFKYLINELVFREKNISFIANSPYTQALILQKYRRDVPIIPNPIKETFLLTGPRSVPSNLELLCVSSSLDKRKNIHTLLLAFQKIVSKYPDAQLILVGAPFTTANAKIKAWENQKLLTNVRLAGAVKHDDLTTYYDSARIFITPSIEETFGNTLLEAMARKVVIVAGEHSGAIPYVLRNGQAGFLCDVTCPDSIFDTIESIHNNYNQAEKKIEWAFNLLCKEYQGSSIVTKHINLYNEKVHQKP